MRVPLPRCGRTILTTLAAIAIALQLAAGQDGTPRDNRAPDGSAPAGAVTTMTVRADSETAIGRATRAAWTPPPVVPRQARRANGRHRTAVQTAAADKPIASAGQPGSAGSPDTRYDPLVAAWSSEPAMRYGGLALASVQRFSSRLLGSSDAGRRRPGLAAAWEFPFALLLSIVTHEVNGHGGRAREFDLRPVYGFDLIGLTAYTGTRRQPRSRDELVALVAGGTEADSVIAHSLFLDLMRPGGAEASTLPLAVFAKIDFTMYVASTPRPVRANAEEFRRQYQEGNDIANYLVARQGQRRGLDLDDLWNQVAEIEFADAWLQKNADALRLAALWNALDPTLITTVVAYARDHLRGGSVRLRAPMLQLGRHIGLQAGTRAFMGPSYVTRYLDVHVRVPFGLASLYGRDLDSSVERTWGWGGTLMLAPSRWRFQAQVAAERWDEPKSAEHGPGRRAWHAAGEVRVPATRRVGVMVGIGHKTDGFLPGRPLRAGTYAGAGLLLSLW